MSNILGILREVPISTVTFDSAERGRKDYGDLDALAQDILRNGLINPITLYAPPGGAEHFRLIAGGRRFIACRDKLRMYTISARVYNHLLNEYELLAIELQENMARKDFTEIEQAQMTHQLDAVFKRINGPKTSANSPGHSLRDTARLLKRSVGSVSQDIKLAKAIELLPELQLHKMPNKASALRALERFGMVVESQRTIDTMVPDNSQSQLLNSYRVGNFFELSKEQDPCSFDIIECDPPYGIDLANVRKDANAQAFAEYEEISAEDYPNFLRKLCMRCYELASANSWMILWYTGMWFQHCIDALSAAGFHAHTLPAVWKKGNFNGQTNAPDQYLGSAYETFIYARKGAPRLHVPGRSNIFDVAMIHSAHKIHPAERPLALVREVLNTFVWPGANVLCPFAGSGATLVAAQQLRMSAVGFDLSQEYHDKFAMRVLRTSREATEGE